MRIHRLNCIASRFLDKRLVNHCLVVETGDGLLLVDTGLGMGDVMDPERRIAPIARKLFKPVLRAEMTAIRQIERMGFRADDVRDIVLTHLDFDQAGGLDDFPRARVHVLASEVAHAVAQQGWRAQQRWRPAQWSTRQHWHQYEAFSDVPWKGMPCVRDLVGLPPDVIVLLPLPGHTAGHAGVAISAENGWHLHCGDAYTDLHELDSDPHRPLAMQAYERMTATHATSFALTQEKLRLLHYKHPDVILNCARDAREFERLAGRAAHLPADPITAMARDPYVDKIVRKPRAEAEAEADTPVARHAPGLEVLDHDITTLTLETFGDLRDPAPPRPSP